MFDRISAHLSYANVMSTLAVFLLLGGGAVAATKLAKDSVKSKQIKAGAVKNPELADNAVTGIKVTDGSVSGSDIADGSVSGSDIDGSLSGANVTDNSLAGADVDESQLGQVPSALNAAQLGGSAPSAFLSRYAMVHKDGTLIEGRGVEAVSRIVDPGQYVVRFDVPVTGQAYGATPMNDGGGLVQLNAQPCLAPAGVSAVGCTPAFDNNRSFFVNAEDSAGANKNQAFIITVSPTVP